MRVCIVGAGAQGRVVLDILRAQALHSVLEFLDDNQQLWGGTINGARVAGGLSFGLEQATGDLEMIVALGDPELRLGIGQRIKNAGIRLANAIHPSAVVMPSAQLSDGIVVCAAAVVNSNAQLAEGVVVNTSAIVEHDCILGEGSAVSPGACLGGRVVLKRCAFVGAGAILLPRITIGAGAVVAAGAVVTRDVPERVLARGAPARAVEQLGNDFDWRRVL